MAKDKLTEYSATNASNDVIGDISVAEGMLPSAVNNALREQMTHLKNFSDGTDAIDALAVDNLKLDGNTISSTDTNGNITIDPDGTGNTIVASGNLGVGTTSPTASLTVGAADNEGTLRIGDNGTYYGEIKRINASDELRIGHYGGSQKMTLYTAGSERLRIDNSGRVTKPSQPAFQAIPSSNQNNIALNTEVTIIFGTERFDVGSNFASNTFTAPVTGKYYLDTQLRVEQIDTGANYYQLKIQTTNHTYVMTLDPNFTADMLYGTMSISIVADMDANDTTKVILFQSGGTQQADIDDESYFSGYLLG
jgi:hypothetical protein